MTIKYFDNAASSWPKPPQVLDAMTESIREAAANPGRGSHQMAVKASRILFEARHEVARLIGVKNPNDISFALNTTMALNQAIKGFVREGDHVICTNVEHNSVRRPLEYLKQVKGVHVTYIEADAEGNIELKNVEGAIQANTTLIVANHSSNLLGTILPVADIADIARRRGVKLLVDGAQTAGIVPIDVQGMGIDMFAFPGHKGLLGPQGTGGLYIHPDLVLEPLLHGGTGSQSESIEQPNVRPDRYEAGTQNSVGIAGLKEGVKFIRNEGVEAIHTKEWRQIQTLMEGLRAIEGVKLLGPKLGEEKTGIAAFVLDGVDSSEVAFILDQSFQIAVRAGYHCTPLAHQSAGTLETGAVRASIGYFTTDSEIDDFIEAIREITKHYRNMA
ncbi:aminotransferase class V-fold PLP-dependent enzyme [Paenibacillus flagellatus]|uniref:cysteine desulfurase n=1 Tax=Paenibacillus flagellatus TaxID=2211139 RepID=A0A2V5K006_9BACL|nr:aminotransferase class V-fold PLP-dependent enzyme [Paenibacillus flagellatus]PYI52391.1 cysteine desulfurase [Paenibacillus flagellatus]